MTVAACYEPWLLDLIPASGRLALDIGANTGQWTRTLAERFATVHAFEPNPDTGRTLALTMPANVVVSTWAVGAANRRRILHIYDDDQRATIARRPLEGEADGDYLHTADVTVRQVTLDRLGYQRMPVDFAKIDVEGAETAVIAGAARTLKARRPTLLIETHGRPIREALRATLEPVGYTVHIVESRWLYAEAQP